MPKRKTYQINSEQRSDANGSTVTYNNYHTNPTGGSGITESTRNGASQNASSIKQSDRYTHNTNSNPNRNSSETVGASPPQPRSFSSRPTYIMDQSVFEKFSRKKSACPCAFWGSLTTSIFGIALLVASVVFNESWRFLGIILSAILLFFAVGLSIVFYSFGKQRVEREIKDYENNFTDKRVPAKVEQKIDELNKRNKIRKQELDEDEERRDEALSKERSRTSNTQVTGFTNPNFQE